MAHTENNMMLSICLVHPQKVSKSTYSVLNHKDTPFLSESGDHCRTLEALSFRHCIASTWELVRPATCQVFSWTCPVRICIFTKSPDVTNNVHQSQSNMGLAVLSSRTSGYWALEMWLLQLRNSMLNLNLWTDTFSVQCINHIPSSLFNCFHFLATITNTTANAGVQEAPYTLCVVVFLDERA